MQGLIPLISVIIRIIIPTGKELVSLVGTGADISKVKENFDVFHDIKDNFIIDIKGIG